MKCWSLGAMRNEMEKGRNGEAVNQKDRGQRSEVGGQKSDVSERMREISLEVSGKL